MIHKKLILMMVALLVCQLQYVNTMKEEQNEEECVICWTNPECLTNFHDGLNPNPACGKYVCNGCRLEHFKSSWDCPNCRIPLKLEYVNELEEDGKIYTGEYYLSNYEKKFHGKGIIFFQFIYILKF
jgi:hypothetical protein